jgi:hypothetical protein
MLEKADRPAHRVIAKNRFATLQMKVGEPGFTSITASASGFEKSGLSSKVYAKLSGGASIASFGDA